MFKFICLFALTSTAFAASIRSVESSTERREIIPLIRYERENNPDGSFKFSYEGGDQSFREESAHVVDAGTEDEALEVSGSYRYIDDEGNAVEVHYTAGKNGFVPVGTNILSEITAAARAAADLPPQASKEELKRKGRSYKDKELKEDKEQQVEEQKSEKHEKEEQKAEIEKISEESKVIEVKIIPANEFHEGPKTKAA